MLARRASAAVLLFALPLFALLLAAGCATKVGRDGQRAVEVNPRYLVKSDIDRVIDSSRRDVVQGLRRLAEKLYRRNPREWHKGGQASLDASVDRLFAVRLLAIDGRQEGAAAMLAFAADYRGDRVEALVVGLLGMVDAAFEHKDDFTLLDDLDAQKLYNCARNVEIALWKLSSARAADGEPLLLSNELDARNPNLSFEREFGRLIGILDLLSGVVADKNGRSLTRLTQSIATAVFLPVGALGFR
jgi:hypothetical protein